MFLLLFDLFADCCAINQLGQESFEGKIIVIKVMTACLKGFPSGVKVPLMNLQTTAVTDLTGKVRSEVGKCSFIFTEKLLILSFIKKYFLSNFLSN